MKNFSLNFFFFIFLGVLTFILITNKAYASNSIGTIDTGFSITKICKDTTCSSFGLLNFKPTINTQTAGATPVTITDTNITGSVWGNEIGWISLFPTGEGVVVNPHTGVISGKAYAQGGGWINFAPTYTGSGPFVGVRLIDNGSGSNFFGWAWVSGAYGGWIKFDCSELGTCLKTDWRAIPYRSVSGGGGGGGGSSSGGRVCKLPFVLNLGLCRIPSTDISLETQKVPIKEEVVLEDQCAPYLLEYIKWGSNNNPIAVKKLQQFLIDFENEDLVIDGIYKRNDLSAVKRFQRKYAQDILNPWGLWHPTGYVYKTTIAKINQLTCSARLNTIPIDTLENATLCPVFTTHHRIGSIGGDVSKIIIFLNHEFPDINLPSGIVYTPAVARAVKQYQQKYYYDIIIKAGLPRTTGIWAHFSQKKANEIVGCS